MNREQYMAALRKALTDLPDEERANALRYYEEYFDDAGDNIERAIAGLGAPDKIARQILNDYRELTMAPPRQQAESQNVETNENEKKCKGIGVFGILMLILFFPIWFALLMTAIGIGIAIVAVIFALIIALAVIPFALLLAGIGISIKSFFLWLAPASAIMTFGFGLVLLASGILLGVLYIKLAQVAIPPIMRGIASAIRYPFIWFRNYRRGGN